MFTLGHTIMQRSNNEVPGPSDPVHDPVDVFNKCIDNQMSRCVTQKRSNVRTLFFSSEMLFFLLCLFQLHCLSVALCEFVCGITQRTIRNFVHFL